MKRFANKLSKTNGFKEIKAIVQQKHDAELARNVRKHNEKQQAQAEKDAPADSTLDAQPQDHLSAEIIADAAPQDHLSAEVTVDVAPEASATLPAPVDAHDHADAEPVVMPHPLFHPYTLVPPNIQSQTNAPGATPQQEMNKHVARMQTEDADDESTGGFLTMNAQALDAGYSTDSSDSDAEPVIAVAVSSAENV